jgi:hypothetical protein
MAKVVQYDNLLIIKPKVTQYSRSQDMFERTSTDDIYAAGCLGIRVKIRCFVRKRTLILYTVRSKLECDESIKSFWVCYYLHGWFSVFGISCLIKAKTHLTF